MNELDPREEPGSEEELVAGCAMLDSCAEIRTPDSLYNVLTHNFIRSSYQTLSISLIDYNKLDHRHYEQNRAPLGLYLHAAWFVREPEMMDALLFWLDEVLRTYGDTVYVVTMSQVLRGEVHTRVLLIAQVLAWMQRPTPASRVVTFPPWSARCTALDTPSTCPVSRSRSTEQSGLLLAVLQFKTIAIAICYPTFRSLTTAGWRAPTSAPGRGCRRVTSVPPPTPGWGTPGGGGSSEYSK